MNLAIHKPYRNNAYCGQTENDAYMVSRAISDYFSIGSRNDLPNPEDLSVETMNDYEISGDPNVTITIRVTDRTGRCPDAYQNASQNWNAVADYFSLKIAD